MSYPRFFVESDSIDGNNVILVGESMHHISKSLRMKSGERIIVCDKKKNEYECVLEEFTSEKVVARIEDVRRCLSEPDYKVVLYQACPKSDKMDMIVQKAVELGVYGIVAFMSDRCVARYDSKDFEKKCVRWQKIALEAAKQSGRGYVPYVKWVSDLKSAVSDAKENGIAFMCYEDEEQVSLKDFIRTNEKESNFSFIIGSEGGFSTKEADYCRESGVATIGLGNRILRTETASGYVLSCFAYEKEL